MTPRTALFVASLFATVPAHAHPFHGAGDLLSGLVHPFLGPDHMLAMLAVVAVFVPSFFMTGVSRSLFVPLSLAVPGAAQPLGLQFHQPLSGKANHLAQKCRVRALLQHLAKGDPVIGHRGGSGQGLFGLGNPTLPEITEMAACAAPLSPGLRYAPQPAGRELLHHPAGHDRGSDGIAGRHSWEVTFPNREEDPTEVGIESPGPVLKHNSGAKRDMRAFMMVIVIAVSALLHPARAALVRSDFAVAGSGMTLCL